MDLRQHFALERTLLAYIRTGLALIGMGFVIARFSWLMRELGMHNGSTPPVQGLSLWFGAGLVLLGGISGIVAAASYRHHLNRLNQAMAMNEKPAYLAVALSLSLAFAGVAMALYLVASA